MEGNSVNEFSVAAKFLFVVAGAVLALGTIRSLGYLTYKMAEAAIEAQRHDSMSYGKFSRQLWGTEKSHMKTKVTR
jgi:hypothetical protein